MLVLLKHLLLVPWIRRVNSVNFSCGVLAYAAVEFLFRLFLGMFSTSSLSKQIIFL
ncbi:hypothetical protein Scep_027118 [Stephania cephalantha]|uniref:Uncharacterized protein n=1 Tax=Stephania cephalantha TaxID=152367 RepID=A0AAP0EVC0_9MAGN